MTDPTKPLCVFLLLIAMLGCNAPIPVRIQPYPVSSLDNMPNYPNSWHSAHVTHFCEYSGCFSLDDGTLIKLFLTGGTSPQIPLGESGTIYVSVPSHDSNDADNTYYFQKFVPDKAKP